jgi:hypothetical protein
MTVAQRGAARARGPRHTHQRPAAANVQAALDQGQHGLLHEVQQRREQRGLAVNERGLQLHGRVGGRRSGRAAAAAATAAQKGQGALEALPQRGKARCGVAQQARVAHVRLAQRLRAQQPAVGLCNAARLKGHERAQPGNGGVRDGVHWHAQALLLKKGLCRGKVIAKVQARAVHAQAVEGGSVLCHAQARRGRGGARGQRLPGQPQRHCAAAQQQVRGVQVKDQFAGRVAGVVVGLPGAQAQQGLHGPGRRVRGRARRAPGDGQANGVAGAGQGQRPAQEARRGHLHHVRALLARIHSELHLHGKR